MFTSFENQTNTQLQKDLEIGENEMNHLEDHMKKNEVNKDSTVQLNTLDKDLHTICSHMIACYTRSYPSPDEIDGADEEIEFCPIHPKMKSSYVCPNVDCPNRLFCQRCLRNHNDKCTRNLMIQTFQLFENDKFYIDYHEVDNQEIEETMEKLDNMGKQFKDTFGEHVDIMVTQWKNEIMTLSKEPLMQFGEKRLKEKLDEYKGKIKTKIIFRKSDSKNTFGSFN